MELYQLRHFLAVAETASFTKAAARVYVTQPALSGSIARLEAELGTQLFARGRKPLALTTAGQRLLIEGTQIVRACDRVKADIAGTSAPERLRLGVVRTFPTQKLLSLLGSFRARFPELQVEIAEGSAEELDEKLSGRKLDLLLTILGADPPQGVSESPLVEERYLLFASVKSPLALQKDVEMSALAGQPFIVRTACETFAMTTKLMKERGINTRVVCRSNQDDRVLEFVRAGIGLALMPELFEAPGVVRIQISDFLIRRSIGLRWLQANSSEAIELFSALAADHRWK
jgi:DNA-binding transcriptional LysR family regulator